ncbi:MAG: hypothetical protein WCK65_10805 [Rhodospirillaceae bacterium]
MMVTYRWLRDNLFKSWGNALVTLLILWGLALVLPHLLRWAVIDSVVFGGAAECRAAGGACWAFIHEKFMFILFGTYPHEQIWRPALAVLVFIAIFTASADRRLWRRWLGPLPAIDRNRRRDSCRSR